jgi:hypothetical protein
MNSHVFLAGLVYSVEFLLENIDWLKEKLEPFEKGECSSSCVPEGIAATSPHKQQASKQTLSECPAAMCQLQHSKYEAYEHHQKQQQHHFGLSQSQQQRNNPYGPAAAIRRTGTSSSSSSNTCNEQC